MATYFSAELSAAPGGRDLVLLGVGLTTESARLSARPIEVFPGGLERRSSWMLNGRRLDGIHREIVEEAALELRQRSRGEPIIVGGESIVAGMRVEPRRPVRYRTARVR